MGYITFRKSVDLHKNVNIMICIAAFMREKKGDFVMAAPKKTVAAAEEVKKVQADATEKAAPVAPAKEERKAEVKTEAKAEVKTEAKVEKKAEAKVEKKAEAKVEKKAEAKVEKKAEAKTEKKAPAKTEKKTAAKKTAAKTENTVEVTLQFAGKAYTQDDLVKIAKDVWKYDLKKKASDFKTVELYVKPEESLVYYVINKEVSGCFAI